MSQAQRIRRAPRSGECAVQAPDDRRFRRAQAKPVARRRRERLRKALSVLKVVGLAAAIAGAGYLGTELALESAAFRVSRLVVQGNTKLSTGEVATILGDLRGQPILTVDLEAWRARIEASSWVASAELHRVLPNRIEVVIVERVPMAIGRFDGELYLIDRSGLVIDQYGPQYAEFDLPIVDGLLRDGSGDEAGLEARAALAARLIGALASRQDLFARLSQVDVSDPRNAVVLLDGDDARLHVGDSAFAERLHSYLELAPALRERVPDMEYVDLRFDSRVFVRPAAGARPKIPRPGSRAVATTFN
jgi:cell division protein FtsQ